MKPVGVLFGVILVAAIAGAFFFWNPEPPMDEIVFAPEVSITIPEGFTLQQIGERVRAALPHITPEEWETAVGPASPVLLNSYFLNQTKPPEVDLEGYLFPDTYRFFADASAEDVVLKMVVTMEGKLSDVFAETGMEFTGDLSVHEILTLASIIEREVMTDEDRALVADIFLHRLEIGMALQADSTVNYVTGKKTPSITDEDRQIDSPWNTYLYPGLPPGPIANPGRASIEAVVNPQPNEYWYFLTDDEGTVHYARTNDEHNSNRAMYLK
jgi:UPF0755 protein